MPEFKAAFMAASSASTPRDFRDELRAVPSPQAVASCEAPFDELRPRETDFSFRIDDSAKREN